MPEVENRTVASRKGILTVLSNPHGLHVVTIFPPRASIHTSRFIDGGLVLLVEKFVSAGRSAGEENW
jgi:hypothetical protein